MGSPSRYLSRLIVRHHFRVPEGVCLSHIRDSLALDLPVLVVAPANDRNLIIVGGGPSLGSNLEPLRQQQASGASVLALNEAQHFLAANGIPVWAVAHMGPVPETLACIGTPFEGARYFMASMCPPEAFIRLKGHDVILWHAAQGAGEADLIEKITGQAPLLIDGGETVALRAVSLGIKLGFRHFKIYGLDSSLDENARLHAYPSVSEPNPVKLFKVECAGEWFTVNGELAGQAQDFPTVYNHVRTSGATITIHGEGLIPHMWHHFQKTGVFPGLRVKTPGPEEVVTIQASKV